jgi:hypothetical protein
VQKPLEVMLLHLQDLAASAGALPMIAAGTATSAPITARCSNRIVASMLLALQNQGDVTAKYTLCVLNCSQPVPHRPASPGTVRA